jgi:hypothetical protein
MTKIIDEQTKLLANLLNTISGAVIVTGVVAPLVAVSFGIATAPVMPVPVLLVVSASWLVAGVLIHYIARLVLRKLSL